MRAVVFFLAIGMGGSCAAQSVAADQSVNRIIQAYTNAVGGPAAIDKIQTRKAQLVSHLASHVTVYWAAPNKVLRATRQDKQGFDGATGWEETKKKRIEKLPHARQDELETDANPIRFVHLRDLYHELDLDKPASVDGATMDVLTAPNAIGATRFFFDRSTHLLVRIEEFGVTSAYYKHLILFEDYEDVDGIKIPTRIRRSSDEPGSEKGDVRLTKIEQNVELDANIFRKPDVGPVISGGKF